MSQERRPAGFTPVHLLVLVAVAELSLTRLAVPVLAPPAIDPARELRVPAVPLYYKVLDNLGLFLLYFGTTLAIAIVAVKAWSYVKARVGVAPATAIGRITMATVLAALAGIAAAAVVLPPRGGLGFALQTAWAIAIIGIVIGVMWRRHDLGVVVGLVALAVPLLIHYQATFSANVLLSEDELLDGPLLERAQRWGLDALVLAAMLSPYCFAPRPVIRAVMRLAPLTVALLVGGLAAVLVRREYETALRLAQLGTGVDLMPGVSNDDMALYLLALSTMTWTLTACTTAESEARREVGVGLGLIVLGGYGFVWPFHFLLSVVGMLTIAGAAPRLRDEEAGAVRPRTPAIDDAAWQGWITQLVAAMRRGAGDDAASINAVTTRGDHDVTTSVIVGERDGVPMKLRLMRMSHALVSIDLVCGRELAEEARPVFTLYAKPDSVRDAHPEPAAAGATVTIDDVAFAARFRVRGDGAAVRAALDEPLRSRCAAVLDGWLACWPGTSVRYRVYPGVGAPMDHPVPVSDLATRHDGGIDRMLTVIDVVTTIAGRVLGATDATPPRVLDEPAASPRRGDAIDAAWLEATMRACRASPRSSDSPVSPAASSSASGSSPRPAGRRGPPGPRRPIRPR